MALGSHEARHVRERHRHLPPCSAGSGDSAEFLAALGMAGRRRTRRGLRRGPRLIGRRQERANGR